MGVAPIGGRLIGGKIIGGGLLVEDNWLRINRWRKTPAECGSKFNQLVEEHDPSGGGGYLGD